jgi:hypothetical protein
MKERLRLRCSCVAPVPPPCFPDRTQEPLSSIPPQCRIPLAREPLGTWVPAASSHTVRASQRTLRRPGVSKITASCVQTSGCFTGTVRASPDLALVRAAFARTHRASSQASFTPTPPTPTFQSVTRVCSAPKPPPIPVAPRPLPSPRGLRSTNTSVVIQVFFRCAPSACLASPCRPHRAASPGRLVVPSEDYSHGRARFRGLFL